MKKILLVFDDYNEMTTTEVYLKKVGFDVLGIGNESKLPDQLLIFNPDIVLAMGKTQLVSSLSVGQKIRDNHRFLGKVILILPSGYRPTAQEISKVKMDAALDAPIQPEKLIQVLAKFSQQDPASLIEKLRRATLSDPNLKNKLKSSTPPEDLKERVQKYKKFTDLIKIDTGTTTFSKQEVKSRQKELKKDWDFEELEKLDELKRQFADALFKKS